MCRVLCHCWVPDNVCKEISILQCGSKSSVLVVDGELSGEFEVKVSVLQGDTIAPFLFVTVLDWVLCECDNEEPGFTMVPRRSQRYSAAKFSYLDFADGIVELEES